MINTTITKGSKVKLTLSSGGEVRLKIPETATPDESVEMIAIARNIASFV